MIRAFFLKAREQSEIVSREIERKLIHIAGISIPVSILALGVDLTTKFLVAMLLIALLIEAIRLKRWISFSSVAREHERDRIAGHVYFILGSLLSVLAFSTMIALLAVLMLSIGDAVSGITGAFFRSANVRANLLKGDRIQMKPLPVTAIMLMTCILISYGTSGVTHLSFPVYFMGSLGATLADAFPIPIGKRVLDDNLTIPIFSGGLMSLAELALPIVIA